MKNKALRTWAAVCLSAVTATAGYRALADDASANAAAAKLDKTYTGTIVSVDPKEHTLEVKSIPFSDKKFNLGDACTYARTAEQPAICDPARRSPWVTRMRMAYWWRTA
jgi:hypothetical protein